MRRAGLVLTVAALTAIAGHLPIADAHGLHQGPPDENGFYGYCNVHTTADAVTTSLNAWVSCTYGPSTVRLERIQLRLMLGENGAAPVLHTIHVHCTSGSDDLCITNDAGVYRSADLWNDGAGDHPWTSGAPSASIPCLLTYENGSTQYPCSIADLSWTTHGFPVDYPQHSWVSPSLTWSNGASSDVAINGDGSTAAYSTVADNLLTTLPDQIAPTDTNGVSDVYVTNSGGSTTLASFNYSTWELGNGPSQDVDITPDGRYVVFASEASNLTAGDTNGAQDIFRFDTDNGTMVLVSRRSNGTLGNGKSLTPAISDNGQLVAFSSDATNLVTGDTNSKRDIFVRDLAATSTLRVSVASAGTQGGGASGRPAISGDGRFVVFHSSSGNLVASDTNGANDVFFHTLSNGNTSRVSLRNAGTQANGASTSAAISATGRYVAYESVATNMVSGDTNGFSDVFVRDRTAATTRRSSPDASVAGGSFSASISADGRYVAFETDAQYESLPAIDDDNAESDVWEFDQTESDLARMSSPSSDDPANAEWLDGRSSAPSMSDDGLVVAFLTTATNVLDPPRPTTIPDVSLHKWQTNRTKCLVAIVSVALLAALIVSRWTQVAQSDNCDEVSAIGPGDPTLPKETTHETPPLGLDIFLDYAGRHSRLRIGETAWGFNHIRPVHGWDPLVRGQVAQVLAAPFHTDTQGGAVVYFGTYVSPSLGVDCVRKVVVEYSPNPKINNQPYYIITTYAKRGTQW